MMSRCYIYSMERDMIDPTYPNRARMPIRICAAQPTDTRRAPRQITQLNTILERATRALSICRIIVMLLFRSRNILSIGSHD